MAKLCGGARNTCGKRVESQEERRGGRVEEGGAPSASRVRPSDVRPPFSVSRRGMESSFGTSLFLLPPHFFRWAYIVVHISMHLVPAASLTGFAPSFPVFLFGPGPTVPLQLQ